MLILIATLIQQQKFANKMKYNAAVKHDAVGKQTMRGKGLCGIASHF